MRPNRDTTHRGCHWLRASIFKGCEGRIRRKQSRSAADNFRGASWVGRISCADGVFVVVTGAGVAETGTGMVEAVTGEVGVEVIGVVVPLEAASFRPKVEVSCEVGESLGRLQGWEEGPSIGGAKFAGSRGGFIGKCGEDVGDFLGIVVLVILVMWNVVWLSVVVRGCR